MAGGGAFSGLAKQSYKAGKDMEERRGEQREKKNGRGKENRRGKRRGKERRGSSAVCTGWTSGSIKFVSHSGVKCCTFILFNKTTKTVTICSLRQSKVIACALEHISVTLVSFGSYYSDCSAFRIKVQ